MRRTDIGSVAVIGAGIAGLAAARALTLGGVAVTIFEKSRGIGGRAATRRTPEGFSFDHGAQFFTARGEDFAALMRDQIDAGSAAEWVPAGNMSTRENRWLVGVPSMNAPFRELAAGIDLRLSCEVTEICAHAARWRLTTNGDQTKPVFDAVIITAPAAQAARLAQVAPLLSQEAASAGMAPCWAIMLAFPQPVATSRDVYEHPDDRISWISRNASKPGRTGTGETWVIHASPEWSRRHLEESPESILRLLKPALMELPCFSGRIPAYEAAHRWRFARVTSAIGKPFLEDETGTLLAAGDWCMGPRAEYAYDSGLAAARRLMA